MKNHFALLFRTPRLEFTLENFHMRIQRTSSWPQHELHHRASKVSFISVRTPVNAVSCLDWTPNTKHEGHRSPVNPALRPVIPMLMFWISSGSQDNTRYYVLEI